MIFKLKNNVAPETLNYVFKLNDESHNTENNLNFQRRNIKVIWYGSETLSTIGPQIWDLIPPQIRKVASLGEFTNKTKTWWIDQFSCLLCKKFIKLKKIYKYGHSFLFEW